MSVKAPVPSCLAWAGALGHTWIVVTRRSGEAWRVHCETDEGPRAAFWHDEAIEQGCEAAIYRRRFVSRRGGAIRRWQKVRPSLAAIS
jgi:hypothetical protein